ARIVPDAAHGAAAEARADSVAGGTLVDPVGLGRKDEVVPVEALDLVGPGLDHDPAPRHVAIRMVLLAVRQLADLAGEAECAAKVGEGERALDPEDPVARDEAPVRHLGAQGLGLALGEGRDAAAAGNAPAFRKLAHGNDPTIHLPRTRRALS